MTEKRYSYRRECEEEIDGICHNYVLDSDEIIADLTTRSDCKQCCDLLNAFNDENEQLKQALELYKELYPSGEWITKLTLEELKKELQE